MTVEAEVRIEQVRKGGLPPLSQQRGQAALPDLFYFLPALLAMLLGCVATAAAQANRSVYTPIGDKQCRTLKSAEAGDDGFEARCRGTAGYSLILSEGDLRQNLTVITPKGAEHSLELWSVVSSGFSSVGPKVEWRLNGKGTPVALILRYNANEDAEAPNKLMSYLAVAKITANEICVTDKISPGPKANEDARRAADAAASKPCLKQP
jgi:hypothetical protein